MKQYEDEVKVKLKEYLDSIEIPESLDTSVKQSIQIGVSQNGKVIRIKRWVRGISTSVAVVVIGFIGSANLSPTFAKAVGEIPVLNKIVEVVTFRQFEYEEENYNATLEAPVIEGLENGALQETLNAKYLEENKKLYKQFEAEVAEMKKLENSGHLGVDTGFEIKTNNEELLSIGRYVVNTVGSSSTTITYDTIDKQNEILITLPSLFKDESYIDVISENIKVQMKERMASDKNQHYWIDGESEKIEGFSAIDAEQSFYITEEGKLMISFDKYEVGPGSMGIQEFEIPTEVIQEILVSNKYVK